jgi:anthranilate synthase component 1
MKVNLRKEEFERLRKEHSVVPLMVETLADVETPVSAFLKLAGESPAFLLESVEKDASIGRYSLLGFSPESLISVKDGVLSVVGKENLIKKVTDPFKEVENLLPSGSTARTVPFPFVGGIVGYLSYDLIRYYEPLPSFSQDDLSLPDILFMKVNTFLIFDHFTRRVAAVKAVESSEDADYYEEKKKLESLLISLNKRRLRECNFEKGSEKPESNFSRRDFLKGVKKIKEYIFSGHCFQVVLSQRFECGFKGDPFGVYRVLRSINPSPYMFYLKFPDLTLVGSSPEPLLRVRGKEALTRPIAGTRKRGKSEREDKVLAEELKKDEKEKAEHLMLLDLGRNDLGRVCEPGTVGVNRFSEVEKYSHVMHLVSEVRGKLRSDKTSFDALKAVFPAGTVSGAPKVRAMQIIEELEPTKRGPYAGAVGYLSYSKDLDTCITIRTLLFKGKKVYLQAGAGIVADSVPERELQETEHKVRALLSALGLWEEKRYGFGY